MNINKFLKSVWSFTLEDLERITRCWGANGHDFSYYEKTGTSSCVRCGKNRKE